MISFRHLLAILLSIFFSTPIFSQIDTCNTRITLLTCGPGEELYSLFGHSALRVTDATGLDIIFNYGTFDFDDPQFYVKFVKGKLLYFVSVERFSDFRRSYQYENRSIIEQDLHLTCEERQRLFDALRINAREENKYYEYEFLFDNCSTRLRDIVANNTNDSVSYKRILPLPAPTFRNMIHEYLDRGKQYWSKFGIDLALASRIDRPVQNEEAMFLPDYLMKGFDSAVVRNRPLVSSKEIILDRVATAEDGDQPLFTPIVVTLLLLVAGLLLTFVNKPLAVKIRDIFDIGYFLILGIVGCFLLFMWLGTDHELCRDNYNLLWALPTHLPLSFFVLRKTLFTRIYFGTTALLSILVVVTWTILPQELNIAFLPLVLLSGLRSAHRSMKK